ncbi:Intracellular serine protease [compost metagenome]
MTASPRLIRRLLGLPLAGISLLSFWLAGCQTPPTLSLPPAGSYAAGELIVSLDNPEEAEARLREAGTEPRTALGEGLWLVDVPAGTEADALLRLESIPGVRFAEVNRMLKTQMVGGFRQAGGNAGYGVAATVNDPKYRPPNGTTLPGQWGLDMIKAPTAWDTTEGNGVLVAVIDTGVDPNHEDLSANLDMSKAANFVEAGKTPFDDFGHGTHVAGIIGAVANNNVGIAGVAPKVKLMPIRVLGVDGGTTAALIQGIDHAIAKGAKVINLSLGSSQASRAEQEAINRAIARKVTVIAAAGNEALSGNPLNYPAALTGVISVGALGRLPVNGQMLLARAEYSCFNPYVAIAAPGSDILSTVPSQLGNAPSRGGAYAYASGTSMAAPMVSGVAALILSRHPDYSPAQVLTALREAASPNGLTRVAGDAGSGFDANFFGAGLIDASRAVAQ